MNAPDPIAALKTADPVLARLIDGVGHIDLAAWRGRWAAEDRFGVLRRAIVGQQISAGAARAIDERLRALIGDRPGARAIDEASDEALRAAGLSRNKIASLRDLAERTLDGRLALDRIDRLSDEQALSELTAVRGIGPWTAEMFLLGALGREDVLPSADLRLRRAVRDAYGLDRVPSPHEVEELGERWRPYRSLATAYLYSAPAT